MSGSPESWLRGSIWRAFVNPDQWLWMLIPPEGLVSADVFMIFNDARVDPQGWDLPPHALGWHHAPVTRCVSHDGET